MPAYFNQGVGYQEGAWHGDMIVFNEPLNVSQAMSMAGMDYEFELHPVYSEYPIRNEAGEVIDTHRIPVERRFDMWRNPIPSDDTPRLVRSGIGNRYKVLQHRDIANILDPLCDIMPVETCLVVKDWQISIVTLRMEDYYVGGNEREAIRTYLHLSDDRSTAGSAFWGVATVREVCYNTYMRAMSTAKEMHRIPHGKGMQQELEFRRDLVLHVHAERKAAMMELDQMFRTAITQTDAERMFSAAFPKKDTARMLELVRVVPEGASSIAIDGMKDRAKDTEKGLDQRNAVSEALIKEAKDNFARWSDEQPYAAMTVYGAFQALTQTVNHSDLYRGNDLKQYVSLVQGDRGEAMDRAYAVGLELIKA